MKLKTALELLGHTGSDNCEECRNKECGYCYSDTVDALELVARRAREEAYEMAANEVLVVADQCMGPCDHYSCHLSTRTSQAIRALPTEPRP